ncbi:M23 family metallopeptidase [Leadbettera azotonutricia]|uniref:LysM domain/M23/M37 peptidase domain protein n=1 Tax=Leadbettera azotonutricia (strain ATCC BAA-888 / DSM 13862 / ZAS-9) TaxID=545695 RepID=F5YCG9_LEAAZ|nr:M23 family metallopeptidase [Leadbettera azotonutricia]AEF80255.1 LysM domain/M23/M37 peptidase domain protein [Leadbettera azotonutricia ZAS-9]
MADFIWLKDKNLLRTLLLSCLVLYLPWGWSAQPDTPAETLVGRAKNGMGGGMLPGENPVIIEASIDLELSGLPEPEEYSRPHILAFSSYKVEKGDYIGDIAMKAGLNQDTILSVNGIKNSRLLQIGQILKIPNQDGVYYAAKKDEAVSAIAEKYEVSAEAIVIANELFSDTLVENDSLFIPGAKMDWVNRQEINGDLFIWPVSGWITSNYGYRANPFGGDRQFHSGLDVGALQGTAVRAAMAGRVSSVGYNDTFGNYVVVSHHSGYRTLYGHLSLARVKAGAFVGTGERIGDVGSTGISTGPHLHFTVYKDGVTVNPRNLMK